MLCLVTDVHQEGHDARVALHEVHDRIEVQVHTLHDQRLAPALTPAQVARAGNGKAVQEILRSLVNSQQGTSCQHIIALQ